MLSEDRKELDSLERGLKDAEAMRSLQDKRLHPLAGKVTEGSITIPIRKAEQQPHSHSHITLDEIEDDPQFQPLLKQLRSHLDSMHNNTARLQRLPGAIEVCQAALSMFIWRKMDKENYVRV